MKKTTLWFFLCSIIFIPGCNGLTQLIKKSRDVSFTYYEGVWIPFDLIDHYIVLKTRILDKQCNFIFDSGAPSVIFSKSGNEWVEDLETIAEIRKIKGADGEKVPNSIVLIPHANAGFFEACNWMVRKIPWDKECDLKDGIIGQDVLDIYRRKFLVDFDQGLVETIDEIPDTGSWSLLNTKVNNGYITVTLEIKGKKFRFKFDTGYSGSLIVGKIPEDRDLRATMSLKSKLYGVLFKTPGGIIEDTISNYTVEHVPMNCHLSVSNAILSECPQIKENLMGMKFIQNFNFILDYENKQVWVQPRKENYTAGEGPFENLGFKLLIQDGKLIVGSLIAAGPAETAGFSIYDEIVAVNGTDMSRIDPCKRKSFVESTIQTGNVIDFTLKRGEATVEKSIEIF